MELDVDDDNNAKVVSAVFQEDDEVATRDRRARVARFVSAVLI